MKNNPAGWYRNRGDRRQHGYWDGDAWVDPHASGPASATRDDTMDVDVDVEVDAEADDAR